MSSSKKKHMEQGKDKVREKLSHISQQQMAILQQIETLVDKGTSSARDLLDVTNKKHFKHKFVSVMQDLEQCSSRLFLIHASLSADAEEDNESSSDSESSVQTDSQKREKANIRRGPRPKSSSLDEADAKKMNDGNNCSQSKLKEMFVDKKEESTTGEGGTEPSFDLHVKGVSEQAIKRPGVNTAVTEPAPTGTGDKHQTTSGATLQPQGRATSPPHKTGEESEFASRSHTSYKEEDGGRVTYTEIETGGLGYEGPQIACLSLEAGVMMDVLVTEVLNPSFFWVQLVNPRLEDLIEQITLPGQQS